MAYRGPSHLQIVHPSELRHFPFPLCSLDRIASLASPTPVSRDPRANGHRPICDEFVKSVDCEKLNGTHRLNDTWDVVVAIM